MVTDAQVRRLMTRIRSGDTFAVAAAKADMDQKTARKYRGSGKRPSQVKAPHTWRRRPDAFERVWPEIEQALQVNPGPCSITYASPGDTENTYAPPISLNGVLSKSDDVRKPYLASLPKKAA